MSRLRLARLEKLASAIRAPRCSACRDGEIPLAITVTPPPPSSAARANMKTLPEGSPYGADRRCKRCGVTAQHVVELVHVSPDGLA